MSVFQSDRTGSTPVRDMQCTGCSAAVARLPWKQEIVGSIPATPKECSSVRSLSVCLESRGVAQPGRALGSEPRGRRFKSCHPDSPRVVHWQDTSLAAGQGAGNQGSIPCARVLVVEDEADESPVCETGESGFEPRQPPHFFCLVMRLASQPDCLSGERGSILLRGVWPLLRMWSARLFEKQEVLVRFQREACLCKAYVFEGPVAQR